MSLTSNFDYCVEMGIDSVRQIFHLAFKSEDRYPHNYGPVDDPATGTQVSLQVYDENDRPADLTFQDEHHVLFSFPFEMTVVAPSSPDPTLARFTVKSIIQVPAELTNWTENGQDVLGLSFQNVQPSDIQIVGSLDGLPTADTTTLLDSIHAKYSQMGHAAHTYTLGDNVLVVYDDNLDPDLDPVNSATPSEITAAFETHGVDQYVKFVLPIHAKVPAAFYSSYGRINAWRLFEQSDTQVTVHMATEPSDPTLATKVELDTPSIATGLIETQLDLLAPGALAAFGTPQYPLPSQAKAKESLQAHAAAYLQQIKFPVYSPQSGDPSIVLSTPVGFLLVADGVLAVLMNRRDSSVPDSAPDNFLGSEQLTLAIGKARAYEVIAEGIEKQYPDLNVVDSSGPLKCEGNQPVHEPEGDATLKRLSFELSDAGAHGASRGHIWVTGNAEVSIPCWFNSDVDFSGKVYLNATPGTDADGNCTLAIQPDPEDFDFDQSCCDVFLDAIILVVGWIAGAIISSVVNQVGGEIAQQVAGASGQNIDPIPRVVNGIAEVQACLTDIGVNSQGFLLPGTLTIRRLGESFDDLKSARHLPKP